MTMESDAAMTTAEDSGHAAHVLHDGDMASPGDAADCEHCPPAMCEAAKSCDVDMSSGCQPDVQCALDSRRSKLIVKNASSDLPLGMPPAVVAAPRAMHKMVPTGIGSVAYLPGNRSPLNLLNCVFLI
jgi:hypothetical protein